MRRTPLQRKSSLRSRVRRDPPSPQQIAWKTGRGRCIVCGTRTPFRHHVVEKKHLRDYAPDRLYDLADSAWVCKRHHERHTDAFQRLPLARIPDVAINFAFEILGDYAPIYLTKRYADAEHDPRIKRRPQHVYD